MSATGPAPSPQVLALTTEYSTPYAALIRDNVVMGIPRYFLERWLPLLGPATAALVNTLRQLDYRCRGDAISISGAALAQEAGMSRRYGGIHFQDGDLRGREMGHKIGMQAFAHAQQLWDGTLP